MVWVPTNQALVDKMLDLAKVTPQDVVMDLGSGDGRTVITAAKRGATGIGVEFNPDMVALSKKNAADAGVGSKATFIQGDLYETDLSKATVITMFLLPSINMKLRPSILNLKPGTRIATNTFTMEDWEADQSETIAGECTSWCTAHYWMVPATVEGGWQMTPSGNADDRAKVPELRRHHGQREDRERKAHRARDQLQRRQSALLGAS